MSSIALYPQVSQDFGFVGRGRFALVGLATVLAAIAANVVVYFIGSAVIGYDPDFLILSNVSATVTVTAMLAIPAVLTYAALVRFTANPARTFSILSLVLLIVSIIPDLTSVPSMEGASNGQTGILILMHIVAAGVIVWMLTNLTRKTA